jgi:hypothetical protein
VIFRGQALGRSAPIAFYRFLLVEFSSYFIA